MIYSSVYDGDRKCFVWYNRSVGLYALNGVSWVVTNTTKGLPSLCAYDAARHELLFGGGRETYLLRGTNVFRGGLCPGSVYGTPVPPVLFRDFNGDGRPDLLMPYIAIGNGMALYTNGPAGFDYRPAWWTTNASGMNVLPEAALGDMNGDGRPDLAVLPFPGGPSVFACGSNGVLASTSCWTWTQSVVNALSWVDVNRDGRADLAGYTFNGKYVYQPGVGYTYTGAVSRICVFTNTGTMLATAPSTNLVFTNMRIQGTDWSDVNLDGFPDLAVSLKSYSNGVPNMVCVYTNNGAGAFTRAQILSTGGDCGPLRFADLNGDWWPDLVGASEGSGGRNAAAFVFTNHLGAFSQMAWNPPLKSTYFDVGDVDGDGDPDVVFYDVRLPENYQQIAYDACLYRNDAGTLTELPVWSAKATSSSTMDNATPGGALADADGDGVLDVATCSGIFLLNAPLQTPAYDESLPSPLWVRSEIYPPDHSSTLVQWDPVQSPEVAGYRIYAKFTVYKSYGPGGDQETFERYVQIADLSATQTQFVVTTNLIANASGWNSAPYFDPDPWKHPDEMKVGTAVLIFTVDKAGREYGPSGAGASCDIAATNSALDSKPDFKWGGNEVVMDLNGDGSLDLLDNVMSPHPIPAYVRWRTVAYTNDSHGTFSKACEWRQDDPHYVTPGWSLCDINRDGQTDMLYAGSSSMFNTNTGLQETRGYLSVMTNTWPARIGFSADTNGTVTLPVGCTAPGRYGQEWWVQRGHSLDGDNTMTWSDANGDGWQDLAMIVKSGSVKRAWLFLNHGGKLDSTPAWMSVETNVNFVAFGDLDHDGKADLALWSGVYSLTNVNYLMGAVVVYKGAAQGLAATPAWSSSSSPANSIAGMPRWLTWFDFDGDGWQDLTVHGSENNIKAPAPPKETLNHPTVLFKNNSGSLAYLCVYKARDYKNGAGVGIGGGSFTYGWADMNNDGRPDLLGEDLILQAADPKFNEGPIGIQPDYWHGNADEEGLGYKSPFSGIRGVYDFNGDGTPDFLFKGTIMLRKPNSIYQADYVKWVFEVPGGSPTTIIGRLDLCPSGSLVLDGVGATQAISVVYVQTNRTEVPVPYPSANLSITLSGNPTNDIPYVTQSGNVITAVRDGSVTVNVKYGGSIAGTYLTASKSVRVIHAAKPDRLEISPIKYTLERIGETVTLSVARRNSESGLFQDVTARSTWQSSDTGVITMTGQVAIARGIGVAEVVATCDGLSGTARVTVAASAVLTGLTLHPPEASVRVGETRGFEVRARFTDGTVQPVTFAGALASDAPGIASVDGLRVLGVAPGFAHITATYQGQTATALVAVDAAVTNAPAATNAPAMSQRLEILGFQRQGGNMALDWYCTPQAGLYTPFSVLTSTNLLTGPWTPIQTPVPRHPSGFHNWTGAINDSPAMFYKVTLP